MKKKAMNPIGSVKAKLVIKFVSKKEWEDYYSQQIGYHFLDKVKGGYRIAFWVVGEIPPDCVEASKEDYQRVCQKN